MLGFSEQTVVRKMRCCGCGASSAGSNGGSGGGGGGGVGLGPCCLGVLLGCDAPVSLMQGRRFCDTVV